MAKAIYQITLTTRRLNGLITLADSNSICFLCSRSSDEDDNRPSASSSAGYRGWKDFVDEKETKGGSGKLLDPDDPFGDSAGVGTPGPYDKPRAHVW